MRQTNKIFKIYQSLKQKYGRPQGQWKLWCKRPKTKKEKEEVIIGAVLTQHTNWRNVELAIANLKKSHLDSLKKIAKIGSKNKNKNRLVLLIEPSGFKNQKAQYLIGLAKFIMRRYGGVPEMTKEPLLRLREELLGVKGVGPETADSILLYALEKPVFVIDEYTRRLTREKRIATSDKYEELRKLFEKNLPRDWRLYQDFYALIVINGKSEKE